MENKQYIIEKYYDMIYRLAASQTQGSAHAEDIVQDVFLKYIQSSKEFDSEEHIKAWLIRVTINGAKSLYMSSWFSKTAPLDEEIAIEMEEKSDVYYAVHELPIKYRSVIHLFYYEEMSIKEIAEVLKTKEATVKSQLLRGRQMLKEKLKGGEGSVFKDL